MTEFTAHSKVDPFSAPVGFYYGYVRAVGTYGVVWRCKHYHPDHDSATACAERAADTLRDLDRSSR
jgi:hypothetical protein